MSNERAREGERANVGLRDSMPTGLREVLLVGLDRLAQVDGRDVRAAPEQNLGEAAGATAALQHLTILQPLPQTLAEAPARALLGDRRSGVRVELRPAVAEPLRAERLGVAALREAGNPAALREGMASCAPELDAVVEPLSVPRARPGRPRAHATSANPSVQRAVHAGVHERPKPQLQLDEGPDPARIVLRTGKMLVDQIAHVLLAEETARARPLVQQDLARKIAKWAAEPRRDRHAEAPLRAARGYGPGATGAERP